VASASMALGTLTCRLETCTCPNAESHIEVAQLPRVRHIHAALYTPGKCRLGIKPIMLTRIHAPVKCTRAHVSLAALGFKQQAILRHVQPQHSQLRTIPVASIHAVKPSHVHPCSLISCAEHLHSGARAHGPEHHHHLKQRRWPQAVHRRCLPQLLHRATPQLRQRRHIPWIITSSPSTSCTVTAAFVSLLAPEDSGSI